METLKEEINQLYEDLLVIYYRVNHLKDAFDNNFFAKTQLAKETKEIVSNSLKSIVTDCYLTFDILANILPVNDETELRNLVDQIKQKGDLKS